MTDVQFQSALARLAPQVDDTPSWDDIVERGGREPHVGWKLAAVVAAFLLTAAVVAGALAEGLLSSTLDRLSAWAGEQPGEPAPEEQAAFERENAQSYAHFPSSTRVGRLVSFELNGQSHTLLGFRDGSNLCLRIVPALFPGTTAVPDCVPQAVLAHRELPVATVNAHVGMPVDDKSVRTIVYGLAADSVQSIEVLKQRRSLGEAAVENNAFFASVPDDPRSRENPPAAGPALVLRAHGAEGFADVPVMARPGWFLQAPDKENLPGPDRVERTLETGSIGWLERGESRGEPFAWPYEFPDRVLHSRVLAPDPTSSFRLAVAYGQDADWRKNGRWYCTAWLWPTVPGSLSSRGCGRENLVDSGLTYQGVSPVTGGFPHYVGLASDEVSRIEIYYEDGSTQRVPLSDNAFSFYVAADLHSKIVAYDHEGRVVSVHLLS